MSASSPSSSGTRGVLCFTARIMPGSNVTQSDVYRQLDLGCSRPDTTEPPRNPILIDEF